jgi:hypothetical protein
MFNNVKGTYFSMNQLIIDEWQTHMGEPVVFLKTVKQDGKTDTNYTNVDKVDWKSILKEFAASDIGDKKFLGKYSFSQFDDDLDNTHNFMYMANDEALYTQKLLITMDGRTNKLKGIYVETIKENFWNSRQQKLYYAPFKTIMIQQYDKPLIGGKKDMVIRYEAVE